MCSVCESFRDDFFGFYSYIINKHSILQCSQTNSSAGATMFSSLSEIKIKFAIMAKCVKFTDTYLSTDFQGCMLARCSLITI